LTLRGRISQGRRADPGDKTSEQKQQFWGTEKQKQKCRVRSAREKERKMAAGRAKSILRTKNSEDKESWPSREKSFNVFCWLEDANQRTYRKRFGKREFAGKSGPKRIQRNKGKPKKRGERGD